MGQEGPEFGMPDWVIAQVGPEFTLLRNKVTGQQLREYSQLLVDPQDFEREQRVWGWRESAGQNVIRVLLSHKDDSIPDRLCARALTVRVVTEHFDRTLEGVRLTQK
jgi:hypothetical protein